MKIAKRYILLLLVFVVLLSISSCSSTTIIHGLDRRLGGESDCHLTTGFIPKKLLSEYEYLSGDFYYYDYCGGILDNLECVEEYTIGYMTYDSDVYAEAKAFVQSTRNLKTEEAYEYNGYHFFRFDEENETYPLWFRMFAYSDESHTLVFIGFHGNEETKAANADLLENDWGGFLKKYYGEHFAFE